MLGFSSIPLIALLLTPVALAGSHQKGKKRVHAEVVERRNAETFSGVGTNGTEHSLAKRAFTGRGTFYYTGLGACGQWSKDSDYMVALNSAQYGGGYPGPQCFKYITIQSNGVTIGGVEILDECPTCPYGGLDLSPSLFDQFHSANGGTLDLTWWFDGDGPAPAPSPSPEPTTSQWVAPSPAWTPPPSPSTSQWVAPTTSTSTWVAPTTSTSTWVAPSSSSTTTTSTSSFSSAAALSSVAMNSTNPFAIVSQDNNSTSTSLSPSASASGASSSGAAGDDTTQIVQQAQGGNLAAINGLVAQYGQLIVVGAGGYN